jgi:hypothetical protein
MSHTPGPFGTEYWKSAICPAIGFVGTFPESRDERRSNARLIAAAPELLDALKAMLKMYCELVNSGDCGDWSPEEDEEVIAARAAIAKAEGE